MTQRTRPRLALIGYAAHPSMRLRLEQYVPCLTDDGYEVSTLLLPQGHGRHDVGRRREARQFVNEADVIVVQRVLETWLNQCLQRARKPLIFDLDDSTYYIRPHQVALTLEPGGFRDRLHISYRSFSRGNPYYSSRKRPLVRMLRLSDTVMAGNPVVAEDLRRLGAQRITVIPTSVPADPRLVRQHGETSPVRIGWIGTRGGLPYLRNLEPAFRALSEHCSSAVQLVVCTSTEYRSPHIQTEFIPWSLETERSVVRSFDIGVMPLSDDPYSRGKSAFKAVLCMSYGIPVVISPVGTNATLVQHGENGFHASTVHQWMMFLKTLIEEPDTRGALGMRAYETVAKHYSTAVAYPALAKAITHVAGGLGGDNRGLEPAVVVRDRS
jgi:glycosyltransferase involved in cell wall biosynthesis